MLIKRRPISQLTPGARFRFSEEPKSEGFPYTIKATPAVYRGEGYFAPGETPVVIMRKDGRYPRYGKIEGYFPVANDEGKVVRWVAHPNTVVLVPHPLVLFLMRAALTAFLLLVALVFSYWLLYRLGGG